jgi:hypothetical protein
VFLYTLWIVGYNPVRICPVKQFWFDNIMLRFPFFYSFYLRYFETYNSLNYVMSKFLNIWGKMNRKMIKWILSYVEKTVLDSWCLETKTLTKTNYIFSFLVTPTSFLIDITALSTRPITILPDKQNGVTKTYCLYTTTTNNLGFVQYNSSYRDK